MSTSHLQDTLQLLTGGVELAEVVQGKLSELVSAEYREKAFGVLSLAKKDLKAVLLAAARQPQNMTDITPAII